MKAKRKTKGISLIVLVLTVIVLSILASAVIISLNNTNIMSEAQKTVIKSNLKTLQDQVTVYIADNYNNIDWNKKYSLSDYGINNSEYEDITYILDGKIYINSNASQNMQDIAKELNILAGDITSADGKVELVNADITNIIIKGNSIQNGTPTPSAPIDVQSVGDKTKNLVNIPDGEDKQTNGYYAEYRVATSQVLNTIEAALEKGAISISYDINGENIDKFSKEVVIFYTSTLGELKYISSLNNLRKPNDWKSIYSLNLRARSDSTAFNGIVVKFSNIQIEQGITSTGYEPYGYKIPVSISGKNLLSYPYSNTTQTIGGVTFTDNGDGSITVNGTATENVTYFVKKIDSNFTLADGEYAFSGCPAGGSDNSYQLVYDWYNNSSWIDYVSDYGQGGTKSTPQEDYTHMAITIKIARGTVCNNLVFKPQIEFGNKVTAYEKYMAPQNVSIYLDEPLRKIGEYEDYIDWSTGKVVRKIYEATISSDLTFYLTGQNWQKDGYTSCYTEFSIKSLNRGIDLQNILSNRFKGGGWEWSGTQAPYNYAGYQLTNCYISISNAYTQITTSDDDATKLTKVKNWFATNDTKIYFPLEETMASTVTLPNISTFTGTTFVSVNTSVKPSVQVQYK